MNKSNEQLELTIQKQNTLIKELQQKLKSKESSLKESNHFLNSIINSTTDGIWDWPDMDKEEEYWSPQWKKLLGYKEDEIEANASLFFNMIHPEDTELTTQAVKNHMDNKNPFDIEYRLKTKAGEYKWFHAKATIYKDQTNGKNRMTGVITDIDHRKKTEQSLEESVAFLELTMNNNPDLIFVKDTELKIVKANKAFLRLYPQEMQDKIIGFTTLEDYPADEAEEISKIDKKAFKDGYVETTESINFPNGESGTYFTQKIKFKNSKNQEFILGLCKDVTERELLIKKLTESNEELEQFAYIASHDLQEPLRMIINFSELLESEYSDALDAEAKTYLDFLTNAASRMRILISDLLEYSKISHEAESFTSTECNNSMQTSLSNLADSINQRKAQITYSDLPTLNLNPIRLTRLFQNLIGNAIKYTPVNNTPKIHINAEESKTKWTFSIIDNGIGMKEEYLEQIFTPFKRLHTKEQYSGTGIGLAVCSKIIKSFGGKIWATSENNIGSIFYFTIPKDNNRKTL